MVGRFCLLTFDYQLFGLMLEVATLRFLLFAHEVMLVVTGNDVVDQRTVLLRGKELTRNSQTL